MDVREIDKLGKMQLATARQILGRDEAVVHDACQQAKLSVLKRLASAGAPIQDLWPYLRRATACACYATLRRQHRERLVRDHAVDRLVIAEASDPVRAAMLADLLLTSDRIVLQDLGSPFTDIFRLRYMDGLSLGAIASRLHMPVSTVKKYHRELIATLQRRLAR